MEKLGGTASYIFTTFVVERKCRNDNNVFEGVFNFFRTAVIHEICGQLLRKVYTR